MGEITRNSRKKKAWLKHRKDDRGTAVSLLFANHCVYFCLRGQAANRGTSQHQPLHPLFLTISTIASFAFTISTIASFVFCDINHCVVCFYIHTYFIYQVFHRGVFFLQCQPLYSSLLHTEYMYQPLYSLLLHNEYIYQPLHRLFLTIPTITFVMVPKPWNLLVGFIKRTLCLESHKTVHLHHGITLLVHYYKRTFFSLKAIKRYTQDLGLVSRVNQAYSL